MSASSRATSQTISRASDRDAARRPALTLAASVARTPLARMAAISRGSRVTLTIIMGAQHTLHPLVRRRQKNARILGTFPRRARRIDQDRLGHAHVDHARAERGREIVVDHV